MDNLTPEQIKMVLSIAKEMGIVQKNDPASLTLTAPALHSSFQGNSAQLGLFTTPGIRPEVWTTLARPKTFVQAVIAATGLGKSIFDKERLEVMTGVTAAAGTNATNWCGNPPTVGQGKVAELNYEWGEFYIKTNLNAVPTIGARRDRSDVARRFLNVSPEMRNPLVPSLAYEMKDTENTLAYENWLVGVHLERVMGKVAVTGDPTQASNATELGFISEFNGLDNMIKTGYTDAKTGFTVKALDSVVQTFNTAINGTLGGGDGRNLIQVVSDVVWSVKERTSVYGLDGTIFGIVMRPEMWRPFVDVYANQYPIYRSSTTESGISFNADLENINRLRLEMYQGQYLLVDGEPVPVFFEEGIPRTAQAATMFTADVYVVPLAWNGIPLTRFEYFDMDNADLRNFVSLAGEGKFATLNNGMFLMSYRDTGMCLEYHYAAQMRLILEAPFLAARIDDIRYTARTQERLADPSDTFFYANGGRTYNT
jgi:hypothetical protein